uniref:Cytochrome P450 n=1 Tax=Sinopodophyllum hexandrum TaxID=93608 RepID=A0A0N9HTA9_SINHE|nr:cytochrome P450 [Sinopodophyllum hexandrum]
MGDIMVVVLIPSVVLLIAWWVWKALAWIWWNPMKLGKYLSEQGIKGPPYYFLHGNLKQNLFAIKQAQSKPMELSHRIVPRLMPFIHLTVRKYGKLSVIWHGPIPRVQVMDPDLVKEILSDKSGDFPKARTNPQTTLLIAGLVSYHGEKWTKHRRILNPAFHLEKLKMMLPAFYTSCNQMVSKWQELVSEEPTELDVWPEFQNLTGDVISRAAFGSNYEEGQRIFQLQKEQAKIFTQGAQSIYIPGYRFLPTKRNRRMNQIYREVRTLLRDMINKREKAMKIGEAKNDDLLGLLMESNSKEVDNNANSKNVGMSIDDVIEECRLFYFAGQETTSTLLVWSMIVLSMHPEWQDQARQEVLQVFGRRKPDFDGLYHLKIVTMIVYEVLRLYPPVMHLFRATKQTIKLGEVCLPGGIYINMPTLLIHRDHELWGDDAEDFNPARFSEGVSKATKGRASFFPFGWGPRICIGQNFAVVEAKMALAMILQHFTFELSSTYAHAPHTVATLQPQYGAPLVLCKI